TKLHAHTMMWDDMLLTKKQFPMFYREAHGGIKYGYDNEGGTAGALKWLSRDIILASWHYGWSTDGKIPQKYPMVKWFQNQGFKVIGVSWFRQDNIINFSRQVAKDHAMGMLGTSFSMHRSYAYATG